MANYLLERQRVLTQTLVARRWINGIGIRGIVLRKEAAKSERLLSGDEVLGIDYWPVRTVF